MNSKQRINATLLALIWFIVAIASYKNIGLVGVCAFYGLVVLFLSRDSLNPALLLAALFYSPLSALNTWRPFVVCFAIAIIFALIKSWGRIKVTLANSVILLCAVFTCFCGVYALIAPNKTLGVNYAFQNINAFGLAFLLVICIKSYKDLIITLKVIAVVGTGAVVLSAIHYSFRPEMNLTDIIKANSINVGDEWTEANFITETKYKLGNSDEAVERMVWAGSDPNYWAGQLLFPLMLSLGMSGATKNLKFKCVWLLSSLTIAIGLVGTYSRTGFLSMLLMGLLMLAKINLKRGLTIVVLACLSVMFLAAVPTVQDRIMSIPNQLKDTGGTGRFDLWGKGLDFAIANNLLGAGMGSFVNKTGDGAHNTYIETLAETGIIGLTIYIILLAFGLLGWKQMLSASKVFGDKESEWIFYCAIIGLVGIIIHINTISVHNPLMIWLAVAIGAKGKMIAQEYNRNNNPILIVS